jgi:hypothetical protein
MRHLSRHFEAPLILQVHDELVWECPEDRAAPFLRAVKAVLERPPSRDFAVPIRVSLKWGHRFGEMGELDGPPRPGIIDGICLATRPWRRRLRRLSSRIKSRFNRPGLQPRVATPDQTEFPAGPTSQPRRCT